MSQWHGRKLKLILKVLRAPLLPELCERLWTYSILRLAAGDTLRDPLLSV